MTSVILRQTAVSTHIQGMLTADERVDQALQRPGV